MLGVYHAWSGTVNIIHGITHPWPAVLLEFGVYRHRFLLISPSVLGIQRC